MTIGPVHSYLLEGQKLGHNLVELKKLISLSKEAESYGLPYVHSLNHLSHLSGVHYTELHSIVDRRTIPYHEFLINKKSGKPRTISAPSDNLKLVQRWIAKEILNKYSPHWRSYAYHKSSSIIKCAEEHLNSKWLIKLDIENFFGSIQEPQVYKIFKDAGYGKLISFELSRLCTISPNIKTSGKVQKKVNDSTSNIKFAYLDSSTKSLGVLPQGAPTSPQLSNIVFKPIDEALQNLADKYELIYTRYADDISFSSSDKNFGRKNSAAIINAVRLILKNSTFNLNKNKTVIIPPSKSKTILGLNIDYERVKLSKSFKKKIELHVRGICLFGVLEHSKHKNFVSIFGMLNYIQGLIHFAIHVEFEYGQKMNLRLKRSIQEQGFIHY